MAWVKKAIQPVSRLAKVNAWDSARRRSCGGEKGKTLRGGWDREVGELGGS
jgi:hypothetical protein